MTNNHFISNTFTGVGSMVPIFPVLLFPIILYFLNRSERGLNRYE